MACQSPSCECKEFVPSKWTPLKCDCAHSRKQHSPKRSPRKTAPLLPMAKHMAAETSPRKTRRRGDTGKYGHRKSMPARGLPGLPLMKPPSDDTKGKLLATPELHASAGSPPESRRRGRPRPPPKKRGSCGLRSLMQQPSAARKAYSTASVFVTPTSTLRPVADGGIDDAVAAMSKAELKLTYSSEHKKFKSLGEAMSELREYLFECKDTITSFESDETTAKESLEVAQKQVYSEIASLKSLLDSRRNELLELMSGVFQDKVNLVYSQKQAMTDIEKMLKGCLDKCKAAQSECATDAKKRKVMEEASAILSGIPEFSQESAAVPCVDLQLWFQHQCIQAMGKHYPATDKPHTPIPTMIHGHGGGSRRGHSTAAVGGSHLSSPSPELVAGHSAPAVDRTKIVDALFKQTPGSSKRHSAQVQSSKSGAMISAMDKAKAKRMSEKKPMASLSQYSKSKVTYEDLKKAGLLDESERALEIAKKKALSSLVQGAGAGAWDDSSADEEEENGEENDDGW